VCPGFPTGYRSDEDVDLPSGSTDPTYPALTGATNPDGYSPPIDCYGRYTPSVAGSAASTNPLGTCTTKPGKFRNNDAIRVDLGH
jgi:hypothetical protein